jgi:acyl-CoA thioester hydrolase
MAGWVECFRGVVYPWDCDHLGHMNVKNYTGMFDQAAFHFQYALGITPATTEETGETTVDAQHTTRFMRELRAGSLVTIDAALTKIGTKSFTSTYRMHEVESGQVAATTEIVSVCFSLAKRESIAIPERLRARLEDFLVS